MSNLTCARCFVTEGPPYAPGDACPRCGEAMAASDTPTDPPDVHAARAEINQPPPIDVAWLRTVPIGRLPAESRRLVMLADTLAHLDTLTARLAVVEGERDAAAATERAAIVAWLRAQRDESYCPPIPVTELRQAANAIESNAHHEATK